MTAQRVPMQYAGQPELQTGQQEASCGVCLFSTSPAHCVLLPCVCNAACRAGRGGSSRHPHLAQPVWATRRGADDTDGGVPEAVQVPRTQVLPAVSLCVSVSCTCKASWMHCSISSATGRCAAAGCTCRVLHRPGCHRLLRQADPLAPLGALLLPALLLLLLQAGLGLCGLRQRPGRCADLL